MSFLKVFGGFLIKNFTRIMGLLFGSAGAHTYLKSGQVASPPSFRTLKLLLFRVVVFVFK